jgi:hypothetical protein
MRGELGAEDARAAAFETSVPLMAETALERLRAEFGSGQRRDQANPDLPVEAQRL